MGWTKEDEKEMKAAIKAGMLEDVGNLLGMYTELMEPKMPEIKKADIISEVRQINRENLFRLRIFTPRRGKCIK